MLSNAWELGRRAAAAAVGDIGGGIGRWGEHVTKHPKCEP